MNDARQIIADSAVDIERRINEAIEQTYHDMQRETGLCDEELNSAIASACLIHVCRRLGQGPEMTHVITNMIMSGKNPFGDGE